MSLNGPHDWEKVNLVTQSYGDEFRCNHCGKKQRLNMGPPPLPGCRRNKISGETPLGAWTSNPKSTCSGCGKPTEDVPREGHILSPLWALEQQDGCRLVACPNGCIE